MIKTYSELIQLSTFEERFNYLSYGMASHIGEDTFGFDRYLNQMFYRSSEWKILRNHIILRDHGCDLGCSDHEILGDTKIIIHHMNPIDKMDVINVTDYLLNPEYLITTILSTHNAIHYGSFDKLPKGPAERTRNDTCPWRH